MNSFTDKKGRDHCCWKEIVRYDFLHRWLRKFLGKPQTCENLNCKYPRKDHRNKLMLQPKRYEWANISGKYKRDIKDWMRLCVSCHRNYDWGNIKI